MRRGAAFLSTAQDSECNVDPIVSCITDTPGAMIAVNAEAGIGPFPSNGC